MVVFGRLRVGVADAVSDAHIPITVLVPVYMTVSELKEKVKSDGREKENSSLKPKPKIIDAKRLYICVPDQS